MLNAKVVINMYIIIHKDGTKELVRKCLTEEDVSKIFNGFAHRTSYLGSPYVFIDDALCQVDDVLVARTDILTDEYHSLLYEDLKELGYEN